MYSVEFLKYYNMKKHEPKRNDRNGDRIHFILTKSDVERLLIEAGITPDDIGRGNDDYCLARNDDIGNYEVGNCRFVKSIENRLEGRKFYTVTEETKRKCSVASSGNSRAKGAIRSEAYKEHARATMIGNNHGAGSKGTPRPQPKTECPHCGMIGGRSSMTRYHFDNCKLKPYLI